MTAIITGTFLTRLHSPAIMGHIPTVIIDHSALGTPIESPGMANRKKNLKTILCLLLCAPIPKRHVKIRMGVSVIYVLT